MPNPIFSELFQELVDLFGEEFTHFALVKKNKRDGDDAPQVLIFRDKIEYLKKSDFSKVHFVYRFQTGAFEESTGASAAAKHSVYWKLLQDVLHALEAGTYAFECLDANTK